MAQVLLPGQPIASRPHVLQPPAATGFDPLTLSPAAWFKDTGLSGSDGDPIGTWVDGSGNGKDATQGTSAKKPTLKTAILNGHSVARFDGTDDSLYVSTLSLNQPGTVFVVGKAAAFPGTYSRMVDGGAGSERWLVGADGSQWQFYAGASVSAGTRDTSWHYFSVVFNGASSNMRIDGTNLASNDLGAHNIPSGLHIGSAWDGSGELWQGDIAEIIVVGAALSLSDRQSVEGYFVSRFGL